MWTSRSSCGKSSGLFNYLKLISKNDAGDETTMTTEVGREISSGPSGGRTLEPLHVKAFLKLIRYAEHKREDDQVYFLLFGGKEKFSDMTAHPNRKMKAWGTQSTAAGAYQILYGTWKEAKAKGIVFDFSPASQDKLAMWKLKTRGAIKYIEDGDVENAVARLRNEWSSLPGASQSHMEMDEAKTLFKKYVKELSK